jgi:hypothetical protein
MIGSRFNYEAESKNNPNSEIRTPKSKYGYKKTQ